MREQIETFMRRAGTDTSGKWMGVEHAEKFAELIVRECAGIAHGSDTPSKDIKDHFGVEE